MVKNRSAGVKNRVPTSDHLHVLEDFDEHHDEHHKFDTGTGIIHPFITLIISTFSTQEIHALHTWHSAESTVAYLTNNCYQETRLQSTEIKSLHIENLKS